MRVYARVCVVYALCMCVYSRACVYICCDVSKLV